MSAQGSKVQFKRMLPHKESVAREIVVMSNSLGGVILIRVKDITGELVGLSLEQIEEYDRTISEIADNIKPIVYIATEVVKVDVVGDSRNTLVVHVKEGKNKPCKTDKGENMLNKGSIFLHTPPVAF